MSRRGVSVGVKFDGDARGFKSAAEDAKRATEQLANRTRRATDRGRQGFNQTNQAVRDVSRSIGSATGQMGGFVSAITSAAGPVAAFSAAIGAIGMAWRQAENDLKGYMTTVQRLEHGGAAGRIEAIQTMRDERRNIRGQRWLGRRTQIRGVLTGDMDLIAQGRDIRQDAAWMAENMSRYSEQGVNWIEQMAGLYEEQTRLQLKGIELSTDWAQMETERAELIRIMNDQQEDATTRAEAHTRATELTNTLARQQAAHKQAVLDIERQIADNTHDTVGDKEKLAGLENDIWQIQAQRENDLRRFDRYYRNINSSLEDEAAAQAAINAKIAERNRLLGLAYTTEKLPAMGRAQVYTGQAQGLGEMEMDVISGFQETIDMQLMGVMHLENAFANMFHNIEDGWQTVSDAFIRSFRAMMAEVAARAAVLTLLHVLFPGTAIGTMGTSGLMNMFGTGMFSGGSSGASMQPLKSPKLQISGELTAKGSDLSLVLGRHNDNKRATT